MPCSATSLPCSCLLRHEPRNTSRERLDAAEKAKDTATKAARDQASLPGCRQNCAALLQGAVNAAGQEVNTARAEIDDQARMEDQRIAADIARAEAALAAAPQPAS